MSAKLLLLSLAFLFAARSLAAEPESAPPPSADLSANEEAANVLAAEDEYVAAEIDRDEAALRRLVDERFVLNSSNGLTTGREELIQSVLKLNMVGQTLRERAVLVEGDVALVFGTSDLRFQSPGGSERVSSMRYTSTYVKREGEWRMLALQMQLGEISGLVRANIALTTQTLKSIRNEQWSELEGVAESVDEALHEARDLDAITDTVWEPIAPSGPMIRKQLKLYRKNVAGHVQELGKLDGRARRQYLEANAEAIVFDTHALLSSLKTHAEYQALRAALARTRSANDENEAQLFDRITRNTPPEIEEFLQEIGQLTESLVRELRIIAELPGRATMPLTKKRKDAKGSKLTCAQLLKAIEPLANKLYPAVDLPAVPDTVCAPDGLDLDPYLHVLRWFLEDGEQLVRFAAEKGVVLQVGHVERFNPASEALRRIGTPRFVEVHRLSPFPNRSLDIDVILDLMIHDLDLLLALDKSKPVQIDAVGVPVLTDRVDIANVRIRFESGLIANLTASRVSAEKIRKFRVFGSRLYASCDFLTRHAQQPSKQKNGPSLE